jgi:4'-phosphopantetheinyl transferase
MAAAPVSVWCVPIAACLRALAGAPDWLSPAERRRADRLAHRAAAAFVAARSALRCVLARELGRPAAAIVLVETASGRPCLVDGAASFSVAHSGDLALLAVARSGRLGVDVEVVRDVPAALSLAREVLGGAVAERLERLPPAMRSRAFLAAWTAHEARVKADGHGLGRAPGVAASLPPHGLHVRPLALQTGHVGALASDTGAAPRLSPFDPARLRVAGGTIERLNRADMERRS